MTEPPIFPTGSAPAKAANKATATTIATLKNCICETKSERNNVRNDLNAWNRTFSDHNKTILTWNFSFWFVCFRSGNSNETDTLHMEIRAYLYKKFISFFNDDATCKKMFLCVVDCQEFPPIFFSYVIVICFKQLRKIYRSGSSIGISIFCCSEKKNSLNFYSKVKVLEMISFRW